MKMRKGIAVSPFDGNILLRIAKIIGILLGTLLTIEACLICLSIWTARSFDSGSLQPSLQEISKIIVDLPNGKPATLGAMVRPGVPTVISLWATWCTPCVKEAPEIAALRRRFGADRLNIILLNVRDGFATDQERAAFVLKAGLRPDEYAVLASDSHIKMLTNAPDVAIPRLLLFDKTGMPVGRITGYRPAALARVSEIVVQ
jgi:thiol-disulfide isomerase/thioredoxin